MKVKTMLYVILTIDITVITVLIAGLQKLKLLGFCSSSERVIWSWVWGTMGFADLVILQDNRVDRSILYFGRTITLLAQRI